MKDFIERIEAIIDDYRINDRQFELKTGKSSGYINTIRKRGTSPSVDYINDILEAFPEYNLNWLILGEGAKLKSGITNQVSEESASYEVGDKKILKALDGFVRTIVKAEIKENVSDLQDDILILFRRDLEAADKRVSELNKKQG